MVLPLLVVVSAAAGAIGVKKGIEAKKKLEEAREIGEEAQLTYEKEISRINTKRKRLNEDLEALGKYKEKIFKQTVSYIVQRVENSKSQIATTEKISEININIATLKQGITECTAVSAGMNGLTGGMASAFGAYGFAAAVGTASTGAAISGLSGAAATNATLAWLGGGSLTAGGLGVIGGTWALAGLVAGPAFAIAGFTLASKAEQALTDAIAYKAEVKKAIAELAKTEEFLKAINDNILLSQKTIKKLTHRFWRVRLRHETMNKTWYTWHEKFCSQDYQKRADLERQKNLYHLIKIGVTIKNVMSTPILDEKGKAVSGLETTMSGLIKAENINNPKDTFTLLHCTPEATRFKPTIKQTLAGLTISIATISLTGIMRDGSTDNSMPAAGDIEPPPITEIQNSIEKYQAESTTTGSDDPTQNTEYQSGSPLVSKLFNREVIGMNIQYFESIAGPAKYIENDFHERRYEVDGCAITTRLDDNNTSIRALTIKTESTCKATLGNITTSILGNIIANDSTNTPLQTLTFGLLEIALAGPTYYSSDCLMSCGNSYDPSVYSHWEGPHASNFIAVRGEALRVTDAVIDASHRWASTMASAEGEDWVIENKYNCNPQKYSTLARTFMYDAKLSSISIGYGLEVDDPSCNEQHNAPAASNKTPEEGTQNSSSTAILSGGYSGSIPHNTNPITATPATTAGSEYTTNQ